MLKPAPETGAFRLLASAGLLAIGLAVVVVFDSFATQRELRGLLREHATSLRQTIAAAARSSRAAASVAESQLTARLLASARGLEALDRRGLLNQAALDELVSREDLFRASVYRDDASQAFGSAAAGRPSVPRGPGGGAGLVARLLEGSESEVVSGLHTPRSGEGSRLAVAVRRQRGGAIVLNAEASAVAELMRQTSVDALLDDVIASAPDIAYVVYEQDGVRLPHGRAPEAGAQPTGAGVESERELTIEGRPVLELRGSFAVGGSPATLQMGMRLDGVRRAGRRLLLTLSLTLVAGAALSALGVGTAWLRRRYALLSERHARAEEALRRRDRLAAMGELASQVAHEVRNPLNAVAMSAQRLRKEFLSAVPEATEDRQGLGELLDVVSGESRRIDAIVQQFLDFARPPRLAPDIVALRDLVEQVAAASRPGIEARGIELSVDASEAGPASIDPDRMRAALENLLRNAAEATPAGGRIALRAKSTAAGHQIEVEDSGAGIPREQLSRVFDLYFTTKPGGTGVGLAVTQQIVAAHGGSIDVDSTPGVGTHVSVRLPATAAEA